MTLSSPAWETPERRELRAIAGIDVALAEQAQAGLVDERRGLQRVAFALAAQRAFGERLEFGVDDRRELIARGRVAGVAACEEAGDLVCVEGFGHREREFGMQPVMRGSITTNRAATHGGRRERNETK